MRDRPVLARLTFLAAVVAFVTLLQLPWHWLGGTPARAALHEPAAKGGPPYGLTLSFAAKPDGPPVDARVARLVALSVPAGTPATPVLPPGPFAATWTGDIYLRIKQPYRFAATGSGHLTVTVNGAVVLNLDGTFDGHPSPPTDMKKRDNAIEVRYTPPATGDAAVRLLWADADNPDEFNPIPPTSFALDPDDAVLAAHAKVREGRALIAEMRCTACHQSAAAPATAMPELKQDAPNLTEVAARLRPAYLAYWITNPRALRPTAAMPRVFHSPEAQSDKPAVDPTARDVAAFLAANAPAAGPDDPAASDETIGTGGRLFTGLGCVACHVAPNIDDVSPELGRVPLKFVKAKFRPGALRAFLAKPEAHYAWSRMPNFHLSDDELTALAGYLIARAPADALPTVDGAADPAKGKVAFESAGCMSCHASTSGNVKPAAAVDLAHADFKRGCVADAIADMGHGVDYALTPDQRTSLREMAGTDWEPTLGRDPPAEFAARQVVAARCDACHNLDIKKDEDNSVWSKVLAGDEVTNLEAALPAAPNWKAPEGDQSPPQLTWAGEKLRPAWIAAFVAGKVDYKPRAWMLPRMPSFASRADATAAGLAGMHGCPLVIPPEPPPVTAEAADGHTLTTQTYFGCVKCHAVGTQAAVAPFEAFAPNFAHVTDRLTPDYYRRWVDNPIYYQPGTKMPQFAGAGHAFKDVQGGDPEKQFHAIWEYLQAGRDVQP